MLSFSLCVKQRTNPLKKIPLIEITISWPFHWPASSLTLLTDILEAGQGNWPLLSFLLLNWIAGIGIVFHCKHNSIHSYIQNLESKIKNFKIFKQALCRIWRYLKIPSNTAQGLFKPFPRNQLASKAQSFPWKSSHTSSPMIVRHARDFTWNQ